MCHAPCRAFCVSGTALQREKTWPNEAGESCWTKRAESKKYHAIADDRQDIPQETNPRETIPWETIPQEGYPTGRVSYRIISYRRLSHRRLSLSLLQTWSCCDGLSHSYHSCRDTAPLRTSRMKSPFPPVRAGRPPQIRMRHGRSSSHCQRKTIRGGHVITIVTGRQEGNAIRPLLVPGSNPDPLYRQSKTSK